MANNKSNENQKPEVKPETEAKKEKLVWRWVRDINFGQHKVGDLYKKTNDKEFKEAKAKGWIEQK